METASKDVLFTIAMELDLPDLLRWCSSNSRINQDVCQNDNVWKSKLLKDYPDYEEFNLNRSLRETYVFMYQLSYIKKLLNANESLHNIFTRKELNLSGKKLKKVLAFDLLNFESLDLSNNILTQVPAFNLPNLKYLYLNNNLLTKITKFNLPNLQTLDLSHNRLITIPAFDLPKLETLLLYDNQLGVLPKFNLPNLQYLFLNNNLLVKIPSLYLPNLKSIELGNNPLAKKEKIKMRVNYPNKVRL